MKKLIAPFILVALCAGLILVNAGAGSLKTLKMNSPYAYAKYYVDSTDTFYCDTLFSDTAVIETDFRNAKFISYQVTQTSIDTGKLAGATTASDTVNDTVIVELFTSSTPENNISYRVFSDTMFGTLNRDSILRRAIPVDSLYRYVWFRTIYWDSMIVGASPTKKYDSTIRYFRTEIWGQ